MSDRHDDKWALEPMPQPQLALLPKPSQAEEIRGVLNTLASATIEAHGALCEKVARQVQGLGVAPERCRWLTSQSDPWERYLTIDGVRAVHIYAEWTGADLRFVSEPLTVEESEGSESDVG